MRNHLVEREKGGDSVKNETVYIPVRIFPQAEENDAVTVQFIPDMAGLQKKSGPYHKVQP